MEIIFVDFRGDFAFLMPDIHHKGFDFGTLGCPTQ